MDTSPSDPFNARTVPSFWASVEMNASSSAAESNSSSLLLSSVSLRVPKLAMVSWNFAPSPAKFFAVVSSRSLSAPFLLAPVGPSATVSLSMLA